MKINTKLVERYSNMGGLGYDWLEGIDEHLKPELARLYEASAKFLLDAKITETIENELQLPISEMIFPSIRKVFLSNQDITFPQFIYHFLRYLFVVKDIIFDNIHDKEFDLHAEQAGWICNKIIQKINS